jgi:hypothetical protein
MRTKLLITMLLVLLSLPALALYQADFPIQAVGKTYVAVTRLKKDGSLFGRSSTKFQRVNYEGADYLVSTSQTSGTIQGKPFTSETVKYFSIENGKISSYSIKGSNKLNGQPWTDCTISFDWPTLYAVVSYRDWVKNERVNKTIRLTKMMVPIQDLDLYLSTLPARKVRSEKMTALLPNGQTFGFLLKLADQPETLTVKGKEVGCRRIELKPDLGLISNLIPNVNYWVRNEPPYELVRYSGAISGPGSPDVIQDIEAKEE